MKTKKEKLKRVRFKDIYRRNLGCWFSQKDYKIYIMAPYYMYNNPYRVELNIAIDSYGYNPWKAKPKFTVLVRNKDYYLVTCKLKDIL